MDRKVEIKRETFETKISLELNLDGTGKNNIDTGIGFFDHMFTHISKHGFFDINLKVEGDLNVDSHHTIEDVGIVFGQAFIKALGEKMSIKRYGSSIIPMDETLALCSLDLSGRPYLNFSANFTVAKLGDLDTEMIEEFFRAVSSTGLMNLHLKILDGKNNHHMAEALFKSFGRALDEATSIDKRIEGVLSTKGVL